MSRQQCLPPNIVGRTFTKLKGAQNADAADNLRQASAAFWVDPHPFHENVRRPHRRHGYVRRTGHADSGSVIRHQDKLSMKRHRKCLRLAIIQVHRELYERVVLCCAINRQDVQLAASNDSLDVECHLPKLTVVREFTHEYGLTESYLANAPRRPEGLELSQPAPTAVEIDQRTRIQNVVTHADSPGSQQRVRQIDAKPFRHAINIIGDLGALIGDLSRLRHRAAQ